MFSYQPARADLWAYVDARGVPHVASERLDARYELFWRGDGPTGATGALPVSVAPAPSSGPTLPAPVARLPGPLEAAPGYRAVLPLLHEAAERHGLDRDLLKALIATESGFDAAAVSPKGAIGLMQVLPETAQRFGVVPDARRGVAQQLTDPRTNLQAGARYLRHLLQRYAGELELALAAYNAGEGAVLRAGNRVPDLRETRHYVRTVLQLYQLIRPPAAAPAAAPPVSTPAPVAAPRGGAVGRGNMLPPLPLLPPTPPAAAAGDATPIR